MRSNSIRLSRRHEWFAYVVCAAVFGTGAAWAWLHYFPLAPNEFGAPSPAEGWVLKAHGAAAMVTLLLLGTLLPMHVKFAWRAGRNLRTGLSLLSVFAFLVLTGYGLYYAGGEHLRAWLSAAHLWVGLALLPVFLLHIWRGKTTRPGRRRAVKN
jgi:cation transport ATPase